MLIIISDFYLFCFSPCNCDFSLTFVCCDQNNRNSFDFFSACPFKPWHLMPTLCEKNVLRDFHIFCTGNRHGFSGANSTNQRVDAIAGMQNIFLSIFQIRLNQNIIILGDADDVRNSNSNAA